MRCGENGSQAEDNQIESASCDHETALVLIRSNNLNVSQSEDAPTFAPPASDDVLPVLHGDR